MSEIVSWLDQLTHKLLHQRAGFIPVHAEDVTPGVFPTGGFDFGGILRSKGVVGGPAANRFWDGLELAHSGSTPYIDFHRSTNPEEATDYNVRIINKQNGVLNIDGGKLEADSCARMGSSGFGASGDYAGFAHQALVSSTSNYAFMQHSGGECFVNSGVRGSLRYGNSERLYWDTNTVSISAASFTVPGSGGTKPIYIKAWNDSAHVIQYYQPGDFAEMATWNRWKFWTNNALWFELGTVIDGIRSNTWLRADNGGTGWYNNTEGCGETAGNVFGTSDSIQPQHNETMLLCRKISQGGWSTAGLTSWGESTVTVPYMFLHANGCCSTSWRKNSGASDITNVNGGGGCDWVYAANHPICSERARKHNISVAEEYGLKTIRGLKPHKFQYTPTDEVEIWQWEKWKHDRAIGIWHHPPNEHCGWDDWHVGYFAEEMENLVPEIVGHHPDGTPRGIDYGNLVVVAIAAINELADRVEDLEAELASSRR